MNMNNFRIYYSDGSRVDGTTEQDWLAAPDVGVQVVVSFPMEGSIRWYSEVDGENVVVRDRNLWTGVDEYDPFGFGIKTGALIDTDDYMIIWRRACGDD
jgi:hypothetical protein